MTSRYDINYIKAIIDRAEKDHVTEVSVEFVVGTDKLQVSYHDSSSRYVAIAIPTVGSNLFADITVKETFYGDKKR